MKFPVQLNFRYEFITKFQRSGFSKPYLVIFQDLIHNIAAVILFFVAFIMICIYCSIKTIYGDTYIYDKLLVAAVSGDIWINLAIKRWGPNEIARSRIY